MEEFLMEKENGFLDETPIQNNGEFSLDPDSPIFPFPKAKSTELISRKRPLVEKDTNLDTTDSSKLTGLRH